MYRKFLSAILFGALTIASTSTFVSCKDYDDDIDALNARVDANDADNKALHDALDAANQELTNLKAQLASEVARLDGLVAAAQGTADQAIKDAAAAQATADQAVKDAAAAQATADQALKLSQENKEAIANEIIRATAAEEALRVRIQTLEEVVIPELRQLIKDLDDKKLDKKTFNEEVTKIYAKMEAIETDLGKALKRIETLEKGLADEIIARKALAEDLEQQKKIIANHETRLKELEEKVVPELRQLIQKLREDYEADVKRIDGEIEALKGRVTKNEGDIKKLQEDVQKINEELEKINNKLNELNVLILRSLRSLVFIPDFYYWGIEATELRGMYYKFWKIEDMPEVTADKADPTWSDGTKVYCYDHKGHKAERKQDFLVENFVARYHLNPTSALKVLKGFTKDNFAIIAADRPYRTKGIEDKPNHLGLGVASFDPETDITPGGDLHLNLTIQNPDKIKAIGHIEDGMFVADDEQVTVFATEVTLNDEEKNVITSDYAALLATTYINGYRLAHTVKGDADVQIKGLSQSYTGVVNATDAVDPTTGHEQIVCNPCALGSVKNRHLFTDADETVYGLEDQVVTLQDQELVAASNADPSTTTAQDVVVWNGTINLSKLAEVHRLGDPNTPESTVSAADMQKNGFEIRFELTGLFMKKNATSESAHAAIKKNEKGEYILRPQLPEMTYQEDGQNVGKAAAYGATKQDRTTIGRTPLVRVMLVDTKHNDHVLDYGYIRLVIVNDNPVIPPTKREFVVVEYTTGFSADYEYSDCNKPSGEAQSWTQKWGSFENDIYNMFSLSQVDFESKYAAEYLDAPELKQYEVKIVDGKYQPTGKELAAGDYIGKIQVREGDDVGAGTKTDVITWNITSDEMTQIGQKGGVKDPTRAIKYTVKDGEDLGTYKDIYVILKAGEFTSKKVADQKPTVTGKFDANKIKEYWYDENTQKAQNTLHEAHLNVPSPEDWISTWGESRTCPFEFLLSSDFNNNYILNETNLAQYIQVDDPTPNKLYSINKAEKTFGFVVLSSEKDGFKANNKAKGYSGTTYTLSVGDYRQVPGWGLYATANGKKELIAYLEYDDADVQNINHVKIVLNKATHRDDHINSYAEDLLNYKAHNDLTDDFLKVILGIGLKWNGDCPFEAEIPAFQVRFLRPINMFEEGLQVQDAANSTQIFPLYDLVHFTDWREQWNPIAGTDKTINKERRDRVVPDGGKYIVDYWYYYNIKHIIIGNATEIVDPEQETALNNIMHTNMNGNDITKTILARVSNNVEFTYVPADPTASASAEIGDPAFYGSIKYTNNRSTVDEFDVTVPITVCYEWGHLYKEVTIHVVKTLENTTVKARR